MLFGRKGTRHKPTPRLPSLTRLVAQGMPILQLPCSGLNVRTGASRELRHKKYFPRSKVFFREAKLLFTRNPEQFLDQAGGLHLHANVNSPASDRFPGLVMQASSYLLQEVVRDPPTYFLCSHVRQTNSCHFCGCPNLMHTLLASRLLRYLPSVTSF